MKSFDNPNMKFSVLFCSSSFLNGKDHFSLQKPATLQIPFDDVAQSFISSKYPFFVRSSQSNIPYSLEEFGVLCEEKRKIPGESSIIFNQEYTFSSIPFSCKEDLYLSVSAARYFMRGMQDARLYEETPFMLCFLERYYMEHNDVVSLIQREEYQKNPLIKRYVQSRKNSCR